MKCGSHICCCRTYHQPMAQKGGISLAAASSTTGVFLHSCYDAVSLISLLLWLLPSCSRVIREVRAALGSSKTISLTSLGKFDLGTKNGEYSYKMEMTNNVIVASHPYLDYITGNMKNHKNCLQRNTSQTLSSTVYVYVCVYINMNIFCICEQEDFCFTSNEV